MAWLRDNPANPFGALALEIAFPIPFVALNAALAAIPAPVSVKPRPTSLATARALSYPLAWSLNSAYINLLWLLFKLDLR